MKNINININWQNVCNHPDRFIADLEVELGLEGSYDQKYMQLKEIAKGKLEEIK